MTTDDTLQVFGGFLKLFVPPDTNDIHIEIDDSVYSETKITLTCETPPPSEISIDVPKGLDASDANQLLIQLSECIARYGHTLVVNHNGLLVRPDHITTHEIVLLLKQVPQGTDRVYDKIETLSTTYKSVEELNITCTNHKLQYVYMDLFNEIVSMFALTDYNQMEIVFRTIVEDHKVYRFGVTKYHTLTNDCVNRYFHICTGDITDLHVCNKEEYMSILDDILNKQEFDYDTITFVKSVCRIFSLASDNAYRESKLELLKVKSIPAIHRVCNYILNEYFNHRPL